jgi:hypothetical protein
LIIRTGRIGIVLAAFLAAGCSHPDAYPVPEQVVLPSGPEPAITVIPGPRQMVAMSDPDAAAHLLSDVFPAGDDPEWRFTGLHPRFRLEVQQTSRLMFYLRFFNHAEALQARGPVSFVVNINGKQIRSPRFPIEGTLEFRYPVPKGAITAPGPVDVSLDVPTGWKFPGTQQVYGLLIHTIGFEQVPQ